MTRIAIVGCGKAKTTGAAAARDLYTGNLFQSSLRHAERTCDQVYIASAQYELVLPNQVLRPYDRTLADLGGKRARTAWGQRVLASIGHRKGDPPPTIIIYAGGHYADALQAGAWWRDWPWERPLDGMRIGERLRWLKDIPP